MFNLSANKFDKFQLFKVGIFAIQSQIKIYRKNTKSNIRNHEKNIKKR